MPDPAMASTSALEALLRDAGEHLEWPPLPDAVAAARNRLAAGERAPEHRRDWRRFALVAAAVAALALVVAVAVPGSRKALADLFGIGGVTVRQVSTTVPVPGTTVSTRPLDLGTATTLDAAVEDAAFTVLVPSGLGPPQGVFTDTISGRSVLSLTYAPRDGLPAAPQTDLGLLVTEFRGTFERFIEKLVTGRAAERLEIDGQPAIWVEGPHELLFEDERGISSTRNRLAANTLVLSRDGTTIRLEGAFDQATAIALARSLEPVPRQ